MLLSTGIPLVAGTEGGVIEGSAEGISADEGDKMSESALSVAVYSSSLL